MRTRKGLSTVVGTVFAIIALTTTITYVSYSIGILDNYNQSVLSKNQQLSDTNKERFQVSSITVPNNQLNITVANNGNLPINFTKIWVQDTTVTDSVKSYIPKNNFVAPGSVLTNIGQNTGMNINSADSYNVKLVTSRGNTQQFTVNSISSTKLNIQLYAFPATVPSGFSSQVVMVVTNNSTGQIVNLTPTASVSPPQPPTPGNPTCTLGSVKPSKSDTLLPGGTAVFTWSLTTSGTANQVCTITAQLANGQTAQTTVTITVVSLSSTTYAQNAGVLTIDYTSFRWTQGGQWNTGWDIPATSTPTAFQLTLQNNNQTVGNTLYISKYTSLLLFVYSNNNAIKPEYLYIVKNYNFNNSTISKYTCTGPPVNDYCISIPYQGTLTLTFAANSPGNDNQPAALAGGAQYTGFVIMLGKFSSSPTDNSGKYGQNLPYVAIQVG